jgi:hypothetical protein
MRNLYVVTVQRTAKSRPTFVGAYFRRKDAEAAWREVAGKRKTGANRPYDATLMSTSAPILHARGFGWS